MSKYSINDIIPVAAIDNNIILLNSGSVAICYKMEVPEIFTLHAEDLNNIVDILSKSIYSNVPEETVIHFQWDYKKKEFNPKKLKNNTFLEKATVNHFKNRVYLEQTLYVYFILPKIASYKNNYGSFKISYNDKEIKLKTEKIKNFYNIIKKGVNNISSHDYFNFIKLTEIETENLIKSYFTFNTKVNTDIILDKEGFRYGDKELHIYSLCDMKNQADGKIPIAIVNSNRSTKISKFYRPYVSCFGLELNIEHRVNLIIYYDNQAYWKKEIEQNISKLNGTALMGRQNLNNAKINEEFLSGVENQNLKIVRYHFSVMFWEKDKETIEKLDNKISGYFDILGLKPYKPIQDSYLYLLGTFPGNADMMPLSETILSYDSYPFLFFNPEQNYKIDNDGFVFNDRLTQLPILIDTFDKPYLTKVVDNRNFLMIAPSGGGKSFLAKNILRQFIEKENTKTVVINIGGDSKIAKTYPNKSLYFLYEEGKALDVNPFYIYLSSKEDKVGEKLFISTDKIEFLIDFIAILWKNGEDISNDERSVLNEIFIDFYKLKANENILDFTNLEKGKMNIRGFYKFILEHCSEYKNENLINMDSLLINLKKYALGSYSNLFTQGAPTKSEGKSYIEFELDNIKDHPILFPIFGMLISDLTFNSIWKQDGSKKIFFIDEAWKVLEKKGMASLLKYLYKTIRKFDGSVGIAVQQITDIPNNALGKAITGNASIKYLLNHSKVMDDIPELQKRLSLSDNTISQLLSVRNNTSGKYPHSEFLLDMGNTSKVLRLEVCKEAFVIYDSDKNNTNKFYELYEKYNDVEFATKIYIETYLN